MKKIAASSIALFLLAGTASAQPASWNNPAGGNWNDNANWDTGMFPSGATETALFNIGAAYTSIFNVNTPNLGSVSLLDPMAVLSMNSGNSLGVNNGIINNGSIIVNNSNGGFLSTISFNASNSLSGTGSLTLNGTGVRSTLQALAGQMITHGADHTITGIGRILGDFRNEGTIRSEISGNTLLLSNGAWTNNNLIEVTNDARLIITALDITQGPAGELLVDSGTMNFDNSIVTGGTIRSMPGETWTVNSGTNIFDSVIKVGDGRMNTGTTLRLIDTIDNDGVLTVNASNGGFVTSIEFNNPFALNGTGSIRMNGSGVRSNLNVSDPADQVVQASTHTIHGMGTINAPIINNGQIIADIPGQQLSLVTNNQINNNLYQVNNGATLLTSNITIDQTGGGTIDANDGLFLITNTTILGGTLTSTGTGLARVNSGTLSIDNLTNNAPLRLSSGTAAAVTNGLENNSTLIINESNGGFVTTLTFNDSSTLSGTGTTALNGSGVRAQLNTAVDQTMTIDSAHTVEGFGNINASLINNGTIDANFAGQSLFLLINDKTNNSEINVQPGAILNVNSIAINQSPSAQINVGEGTMTLLNTTINDGTINATTGTVNQTSGTTFFNSMIINAPVNLNSGTTVQITNDLVMNDTLAVNPSNGGFVTNLLFADSSTLTGNGEVRLGGSSVRSQINTSPSETMTIDSGFNINGFGHINASLINNGRINSDIPGQTLTLLTNDKINNSLIFIEPSSRLTVSGITIDQSAGGVILNNDGLLTLTGATIQGGTIDALAGGTCTVTTTSTLDNLTNLSPINANSGVVLNVVGTINNESTIGINPSNGGFVTNLNSVAPATILGIGEIILGGNSVRSQISGAGMTIGADQTLSGIGLISAPLTLDGTLAPGFSVGEIDASAPITLSDSSVYEVEVAAENSRDLIDSSSTFHADGTLDLSLIDGFAPDTAWVTTIVTADMGVTGTFDTIIAPPPPTDPRLQFEIGYFDNEIRVGAICKTDFNFSGDLDFFDVSRFLDLFNAQDALADINGDGEFDFFDVSAFLNSFGMGCP